MHGAADKSESDLSSYFKTLNLGVIMLEYARKLLEDTDWTVEDESVLICPCGDRIEWDGFCPDCGKSPLIEKGVI